MQNERFYEIHKSYYKLLRRIASQKGIPYDEIDDMVQEAFISYYEHYPVTWPEERIRVTLAKIQYNLCMDFWRKRCNRDVTCMAPEDMQDLSQDREEMMGQDNLSILIQREQYQDVGRAFRSMKREWAEVLQLNILEGCPMHEVSRRLGISETLCRMRLMRGRRYLKEHTVRTT